MEVCQETASSRTNLWVYFDHQQPWESRVILQERDQPHPRCPQCDMFVSKEALNWAPNFIGVSARGREEATDVRC